MWHGGFYTQTRANQRSLFTDTKGMTKQSVSHVCSESVARKREEKTDADGAGYVLTIIKNELKGRISNLKKTSSIQKALF